MSERDGRAGPALEPAELVRVALVAVAVAVSGSGLVRPAGMDLVALAGAAAGGYPIWRSALSALLARRMTMELSMTIAVAAALAIGEFFTALVIVLFVLGAEILEGLTVHRGRHALRRLAELLPRTALLRDGAGEREVPSEALRPGDVVVVKPGSRIPVDGVVEGGASHVDQSAMTGEPLPAEKSEGSDVFAGSINQSGVLYVRATGVGHDTAFGKIVDAVGKAEEVRAPLQRLADRLAGYLVYFALACAALTFLLTRDMRSTISVVIVAGACGIAAGTPLAFLGGIGRAARLGVIVKGSRYLEALALVDTVVFDKTGTVTFGEPLVTAVLPAAGVSERELLEAAALAERRSEHAVARAVLRRAAQESIAPEVPEQFEYAPGLGVRVTRQGVEILAGSRVFLEQRGVGCSALPPPPASGTAIAVARGGRLLGALELADGLRPEAVQAVRELRQLGLRTHLLTGDSAAATAALAATLGLHPGEAHAGLLPDDKRARVAAMQLDGHAVAMVGDGINDAPALVEASVGIAMGTGTDVATESADLVLIGSDLLKLVETVRVARRCRRIVLQNFAGTLAVDGLGVLAAALGMLNPMLAAFIHVASELAFLLNAARLVPVRAALRGELSLRPEPPAAEAPLPLPQRI